MRELVEIFLTIVVTIIPIVNPLSAVPVFIAMTEGLPPSERNKMANRVGINSFILIAASLFVGNFVLNFFSLSIPIVQLGGGVLVCAVAWDLLRAPAAAGTHTVNSARNDVIPKAQLENAFYPLTLPVTVGPGTISVAITIGANHAHSIKNLAIATPPFLLGTAAVAVIIWACFRWSHQIVHVLGSVGAAVVGKLFAFILLCVGVQITWNGIAGLVKTLIH